MAAPAPLAAGGGLELLVPECPKGIGSVIQSPDSDQLIEGVRIHRATLWPDDRGYFLEIARMGQDQPAGFAASGTQVSAALSYPGTIKAFHYHLHQADFWTPAMGMFQAALVDLRKDSPTFGRRNTVYAGALRPWQLLIPAGVAHGYKVIGTGPAMLVYLTSRHYDPSDEGRLPYDDPRIRYDWEMQHK